MSDCADEIRARVGRDGQLIIEEAEALALADAFDFQDAKLKDQAADLEAANLNLARANLIIKMARTFGLSPVLYPDREAVIPFLRAYIDDGLFKAIPWPTDLPAAAQAMAGLGYINVGGFAERSTPISDG
jgi:hypothetical protein